MWCGPGSGQEKGDDPMKRRRWGIVGVCAGVVLLLGSMGVRLGVAPALVRFPLDLDETAHYAGRGLTYVDAKTLLPLAKPTSVPITVDRHVKVVSGSFSRAVVDETITIKAGSTTTVEDYQYVMDRRTMQLVDDPREYAFGDPKALMSAAGSYRVNFAMGTKATGSYRSFIPEAGVSAPLKLVEDRHFHDDGRVSVIDFSTKLLHPVAPYYLAHLQAIGLPMQITTAQLQPQLVAAGVDVNKALADVGSQLTPAERTLVTDTLSRPIPLRYYFIADGIISIEPKTGALIDVHSTQEGVAVKPDLSGAAALNKVLQKYSSIPSVKAAAAGLATLSARGPQPAQMYVYTQTVPSSLHVASKARQQASQMNLIQWRLPAAMVLLGALLLVGGLLMWFGSR
ncbi:MAG TPA: porin PorA family protein, partial [Acidimicrobiia bacterium]